MTAHTRAPWALATDSDRLTALFGRDDLLSLWIAEPYVDIAPGIQEALSQRAALGWYGYEARAESILDTFWEWMQARHGWNGSDLEVSVSPSVGTSIGAMIELLSDDGDGVILQPPVFTDFKPLIVNAGRRVVRNPLILTDHGYRMDLDHLDRLASDRSTRLLILCNPHNPVGRLWSEEELHAVAEICSSHQVAVVADEIHSDLTLGGRAFTPFACATTGTDVLWAAIHGPIKTFGLAGVCDTLLSTDSAQLAGRFREMGSRLHLTRNNVFGLAALDAAYRTGADWLDSMLALVSRNLRTLHEGLDERIPVIEPEATYLAWIDLRHLGLDAPELAGWLADAGLALSPGHWFGREGAGFARMTVAAPEVEIAEATELLNRAIAAIG
jgi:cystathionine beta-lyase